MLHFLAKCIGLAIFSIVAAACSIRPIPPDVTRHSTYLIAQRIRCEFRVAIKDLVQKALIQEYRGIADELADGRLGYDAFFKKRLVTLDPVTRGMIERYRAAVIAYDFDFDISEENNLSGGIGLTDLLSRGPLTLGITAKDERKRQDKRNFKLVDQFEELTTSPVMDRVCVRDGLSIADRNHSYPIDGSLNLAEMLGSFISLVQSANLIGDSGNATSIPTFADTLTFTTTLSGTINPKLTLTPAGSALQISSAELSVTKARIDTHKLIVALTLPSAAGPRTVAQSRSELERAAVFELERQRVKAIDADTEAIRRSLLRR
jgi:hypothetical protein